MKIKTSITLSDDVLAAIDRLAGTRVSRSALIERVLREHIAHRARTRAQARELASLNRNAAKLNAESEDVLEYQAGWMPER